MCEPCFMSVEVRFLEHDANVGRLFVTTRVAHEMLKKTFDRMVSTVGSTTVFPLTFQIVNQLAVLGFQVEYFNFHFMFGSHLLSNLIAVGLSKKKAVPEALSNIALPMKASASSLTKC